MTPEPIIEVVAPTEAPTTTTTEDRPGASRTRRSWPVARLLASWVLAVTLLAVGLPKAIGVSWNVVLPVLVSLRWTSALALAAVWFLGLYAHSFLVTAAAPGLTRPRAVTVKVTGSAVASVLPFGGAAGLEVNRRMLRSWGVVGRAFAGYALLINLWSIGCKLLLPFVAVVVLAAAGEAVTAPMQAAGLASGLGFLVLALVATALLVNQRWALVVGRGLDAMAGAPLRVVGRRPRSLVGPAVVAVRRDCRRLVARGWLWMSAGMTGYVVLQCLLLGLCLHLAGAGNTGPEVLAGFAAERMLTILPLTPGGVGIGDLGLIGVLVALGGDPVAVTAAAVLYRTFVFAVEVPAGACILGLWLLRRRVRSPEVIAQAGFMPVGVGGYGRA